MKHSPRDNLLSRFFSLRTRERAISELKQERNYAQRKSFIPKLGLKGALSHLAEDIFGKTLVTEWDHIMAPPPLRRSNDWIQELGWIAHGFIENANNIRFFITKRSDFGRNFLLGEYEAAENTLNEIEQRLGISLWLCERRFMLLQSNQGFPAHKEALSKIQSKIKNSLIGYIITTTSNRLEPHVTQEAYLKDTSEVLADIRKDGHEEFADWIELHISPWTFSWLPRIHHLIHKCAGKPLIDRYERILKIVSCLNLAALKPEEKNEIIPIINDLDSIIPDRQIKHIYSILTRTPCEPEEKTRSFICALDKFVEGKYEACLADTITLLKSDPTCFDFYWLIARAAACCKTALESVDIPKGSHAHHILLNLIQIAENKTSVDIPLAALTTLALKLGDNHLGLSLWQFCEYENSDAHEDQALNQIHIQNKIDTIGEIFNVNHSRLQEPFLDTAYEKHTSIALRDYQRDVSATLPPPVNATSFMVALANANKASLRNDPQAVLYHLAEVKELTRLIPHEFDHFACDIAPLEFNALLELDKPNEAARAVVKSYIRNPNSLRHVRFEILVDECNRGKWAQLKKKPSWPILVYLNNGDAQDIYEALDDFLIESQAKTPLSLVNGEIECPDEELKILLRDVLVPEVLARGAFWNKSAEEVRNMRRHFLKNLYSVSVIDQEQVVEELSHIEQDQLLDVAYKNIEGPKFDLSRAGNNRLLSSAIEGMFARYTEYRAYEEGGGTLATDAELLSRAKEGAIAPNPSVDKGRETSELLLRHMVTMVFLDYLTDTSNGVNAALGTRIRHGSLENQLTRTLGAYGLLSTRNQNGAYQCDKRVTLALQGLGEAEMNAVTSYYNQFTDSISLLLKDIISSKLRVRLPQGMLEILAQQGQQISELRSEEGLLDFSPLFEQETLEPLKHVAFSSAAALVLEAERVFTQRAQIAFAEVRRYFENDVAETINNSLSLLDSSLIKTLPESQQRAELLAAILSARNEFTQDIGIISNWFSSAHKCEIGVGSLDDVATMATKVVNFASNGKLGELKKGVFHNEELKPETGMLLYEVFSILLRNIVQHSKLDQNQEVEISHVFQENEHTLSIENKISPSVSGEELAAKASLSIARPFDEWALGTSPGGTGISRIRKLLRQAGYSNVDISAGFDQPLRKFKVIIRYSQ